MAKFTKTLQRGLGLMFIGYAVGLLTAPRSGKQTRRKLKNEATSSMADIEKDLKSIYKETKIVLDKIAEDKPKLTAKLKDIKATALKSQTKLKNLLSTIHGQDNVDEDLEAALYAAKQSLADLKHYLTK